MTRAECHGEQRHRTEGVHLYSENNQFELTLIRSECLSRGDLPCRLVAPHKGVHGSEECVSYRKNGLAQVTNSAIFLTSTGEKSTRDPLTTIRKQCGKSGRAQQGPSFQCSSTWKCHLPAHAKEVCTVFRSHFGVNIGAMRLNGLGPHTQCTRDRC